MNRQSLRALVESALAGFLQREGFAFVGETQADAGNIENVFYRSDDGLQLGFYRSQREGEVNCLAGTSSADSAVFPKGIWRYVRSWEDQDRPLSFEELLSRVPEAPRTDEQQLAEIRDFLEARWPFVRVDLLSSQSGRA